MRGVIFFLAGLAAGAAVGSGVTALISAKRNKKRLAAVEATADAVKEHRAKTVKVLEAPAEEEPAEEVDDISEEDPDESPERESDGTTYAAARGPYEPSPDHPYLITREEYEDYTNNRVKRLVNYYTGDDTAIFGDTGEEVDIVNELGSDMGNLEEDRFDEAEDGYVYIRNPFKSEDYRVDLYPGIP